MIYAVQYRTHQQGICNIMYLMSLNNRMNESKITLLHFFICIIQDKKSELIEQESFGA